MNWGLFGFLSAVLTFSVLILWLMGRRNCKELVVAFPCGQCSDPSAHNPHTITTLPTAQSKNGGSAFRVYHAKQRNSGLPVKSRHSLPSG